MGYSEDTDAIRRRITVVPYRSKFTTEIQGDRCDTLRYKFQADPQLSNNLVTEPKYWQALFYSLLPYAQELTKNKVKALSDIKRPKSIIEETNKSFMRSNGLVGWLANNVKPCPGYVLSVSRLRETIENANINEITNKRGPILNGKKPQERTNEIHAQVGQTFMGRVYILQDMYYNKNQSAILRDTETRQPIASENIINESIDRTDPTLDGPTMNNQIIAQWFDPYAVNNLSFSHITDKEDLFILGYRLAYEIEDVAAEQTIDENEQVKMIESKRKASLKRVSQGKSSDKTKPKADKDLDNEVGDFV